MARRTEGEVDESTIGSVRGCVIAWTVGHGGRTKERSEERQVVAVEDRVGGAS